MSHFTNRCRKCHEQHKKRQLYSKFNHPSHRRLMTKHHTQDQNTSTREANRGPFSLAVSVNRNIYIDDYTPHSSFLFIYSGQETLHSYFLIYLGSKASTLPQAGLPVILATHALTWGRESNNFLDGVPNKAWMLGRWCRSAKVKLSPARYLD